MADWGKILSRGNVEDRRGFSPVKGGLSIGAVVLVLAVNYFMGGDMSTFLQMLGSVPPTTTESQKITSAYDGNDAYEDFASTILGSNNDVWTDKLQSGAYTSPKLVLFREGTTSGCGGADSRYGPHYCPNDQTIYLDETFFDELTSRLGARGGDVAQAYVISHEVGHHVQHLQGTLEATGESESVQVELQADCYAGVWAHSLRDQNIFEPGEIDEAMDAAAAVGDDRIQQKSQGYVNPETWTHGSSEQRVKWFNTGYNSGSIEQCNTFSG